MIRFVILFRNTQNGRVGFVSDGDTDRMAGWTDRDEAEVAARHIPICEAFPYQIVELDI